MNKRCRPFARPAGHPGVAGVHDVRTRKMGDMVVVDAHLEVDAQITVEEGHDIAVEARQRVMQRHRCST